MTNSNIIAVMMFVLSAWVSQVANAQITIDTYRNPSNLQVLPADISPERLRDTMFSFGQQVGLRCAKCHDFDPDTPADERDYASDRNELKRVAREMMLMMESVNFTISQIYRNSEHKLLAVQCVTCHRGVSLPRQIGEIFTKTISDAGVSSAIEQYRQLRQEWYATGAYDFSAWRLGLIAQEIFDGGTVDGAMQVHALNLELNPQDGSVYYHRAETYEKQGRIEDAITDFERALEMEEESFGFLRDRIARLRTRLNDD